MDGYVDDLAAVIEVLDLKDYFSTHTVSFKSISKWEVHLSNKNINHATIPISISLISDNTKLEVMYSTYNTLTLDKWNAVVGNVIKTALLEHSFIKEEFKDLIFHVLHTLTPNEEQAKVLVKEIKEMSGSFTQEGKHETVARRARSLLSILGSPYKH